MKALSVLELMLVIATKHLSLKSIDQYTFLMVYEEYKNFCRRQATPGLIYTKECVRKGYEVLVNLEIIVNVGSVGEKEYQMSRCIYIGAEIDQIALHYENIPGPVLKW